MTTALRTTPCKKKTNFYFIFDKERKNLITTRKTKLATIPKRITNCEPLRFQPKQNFLSSRVDNDTEIQM